MRLLGNDGVFVVSWTFGCGLVVVMLLVNFLVVICDVQVVWP
jgi:hypothetical protein